MYFPIGWPKILKTPEISDKIIQVVCNRDKIYFVILTEESVSIWYCKPCVPVVYHRRTLDSISKIGPNVLVEWKPDSSMLAVATSEGHLLLYNVGVTDDPRGGLYQQTDPPMASLRRDSAELFVKEVIPPLTLSLNKEVSPWRGRITQICCISAFEMMLSTERGHLVRYRWDGTTNGEYCLDLRRVTFCFSNLTICNVLDNAYVIDMEYSPLIGGFAVVLSDGRAAFLTSPSLRFEPNQVQGIWAPEVDDATCTCINHKYRLIAFGRKNSTVIVFTIDETTGGLELSHHMRLGAKDWGYGLGAVRAVRCSPDGCAVAVSWQTGGLSLWSTFGALLMCTLAWDYGLIENSLNVISMDWSAEGYQLWMVRWQDISVESSPQQSSTACSQTSNNNIKQGITSTVVQLDFVKSSLSVNPCMSQNGHLYLQGDDRLYINLGENLVRTQPGQHMTETTASGPMPSESKNWLVVPIATQYSATNWPVRYSAIDSLGQNLAIAGRYGLALYSMSTRKWKLFGNETQEKDFVVTGGLLWWRDYVIMGCYSILENHDEVRIYPRDCKLDNRFVKVMNMPTQVLIINSLNDRLVVYCADSIINIYGLRQVDAVGSVDIVRLQAVDISALCPHPACVISVSLTRLRTESSFSRSFVQENGYGSYGEHRSYYKQGSSAIDIGNRASSSSGSAEQFEPGSAGSNTSSFDRDRERMNPERRTQGAETMVLNISGRLIMVQRERSGSGDSDDDNGNNGEKLSYTCSLPTVLASCVESVWSPPVARPDKPHLTDALWLYCGAHGMRVWLPIFPKSGGGKGHHSFMSKRIMLPFQLKIYPLAILFEDAIILGAENDTMLYTSDSNSPFSLPFCVLERTSQVYLHQILRQLIRRNLGYHAYEIAVSCTNLPYFPHSLELLLHEVLEEEATCKEPIPDAQLPSVIEFIQEFPVYLQTVVQCARKTEIALWPYLFSAAGKPKELFKECLAKQQLDTAASYLIILQNLEPSSVSRQFATLLLDTALDQCKWELSRDLVRFLRAIDPNDVESPRNSLILTNKFGLGQQTPPVSPNAEELSLILGTMQVTRGRSFSTSMTPKVQTDTANVGTNLPQKQTISSGAVPKATTIVANPMSPNNMEAVQMRRKKSVPSTRTDNKENTTAEQFFIDLILQRHARRLLTSQNLTLLGQMSAALDFPLVSWLNKERERAARVDCFVKALKRLHDEFEWPRPILGDRRGSVRSHDSYQSFDSATQSLRINTQMTAIHPMQLSFAPPGQVLTHTYTHSRVAGDSGYMSFPGGLPNTGLITPVHSEDTASPSSPDARPLPFDQSLHSDSIQTPLTVASVNQMTEARLVPRDDSSVISEQISQWADDISLQSPDMERCLTVLETLSNQVESKGSHRSEVQLRYLLQIFTEAGCLEWSLLISVLLRDAMAVLRTINAARSSNQTADSVQRLRDGLQSLCQWVYSECLGYKPFMVAIQNQIPILTKLLSTKEPCPTVSEVNPDPMQGGPLEFPIVTGVSTTSERKSIDGSSNKSSMNRSIKDSKELSRKSSLKHIPIPNVSEESPKDNDGVGCVIS